MYEDNYETCGNHPKELKFCMPSQLDDYGLDPYELRVYLRIARRSGDGYCRESVLNMAKGCLMTDDKVRECLIFLEAARLIYNQERPGKTTLRKTRQQSEWISKEKLPILRKEIYTKRKSKFGLNYQETVSTPPEFGSTTPAENSSSEYVTPAENSSSENSSPLEFGSTTPTEFTQTPLPKSAHEGITSKDINTLTSECDNFGQSCDSLPDKPINGPRIFSSLEKTELRFKYGPIGNFWPALIGTGLEFIWKGPRSSDFDEQLVKNSIAHLKKYDRPHQRADALQYIRNCLYQGKLADLEARISESENADSVGNEVVSSDDERGKNWHEKRCWAVDWEPFYEEAVQMGVEIKIQRSGNPIYSYRLPNEKEETRLEFTPRLCRLMLDTWREQIGSAIAA